MNICFARLVRICCFYNIANVFKHVLGCPSYARFFVSNNLFTVPIVDDFGPFKVTWRNRFLYTKDYDIFTNPENIDECASAPCLNGAECQDGNNSYACVCQPGFTGEHCEGKTNDVRS